MSSNKINNIPTNLIMGFLGVGKTTAILDLIKQKPEHENWAVLVNEFGKVGIDGAIYTASGISVKEVAGGCLCCAVGLPFQVSLNRLIKEVKPDRLLIEPSGLGHPKKVLDRLVSEPNSRVLDVRASLCLVYPEKLKESRYIQHESFVDQIALADVLVANKIDLADQQAIRLFHQWAAESNPPKSCIAQTIQGKLDVSWLDLSRNLNRKAIYPNIHSSDSLSNQSIGYQSAGYVFPKPTLFDFAKLNDFLNQLKVDRIKGVVHTDRGWFMINGVGTSVNFVTIQASANNRVEIVAKQRFLLDISVGLDECIVKS